MAKKDNAQAQAQAQAQDERAKVQNPSTEIIEREQNTKASMEQTAGEVKNVLSAFVSEGVTTLSEVGTRVITYQTETKNGIVTHTIFNPTVVSATNTICMALDAGAKLDRMECIELATMDAETLKGAGVKGGLKEWFKDVLKGRIDPNTASRYRRVGRVFGRKYEDEDGVTRYEWRHPIPEDASLTVLAQVLPLVGLPKGEEGDKLTEEEVTDLFRKFCKDYVYTGRLTLNATLSTVRDQIKKIQNPDKDDITIKPKEVTDSENSAQNAQIAQEQEVTPEMVQAEQTEEAILAVQFLYEYFKADENALTHLEALTEILNAQTETENK